MVGLEDYVFCLLRGKQHCNDCWLDICDTQCLCWWVVRIAVSDWVIIVSIRMAAAGSSSSPVVSSVENIINIRCRVPPSSCIHKHHSQHVWSAVTANQVRWPKCFVPWLYLPHLPRLHHCTPSGLLSEAGGAESSGIVTWHLIRGSVSQISGHIIFIWLSMFCPAQTQPGDPPAVSQH